MSVIEEPERAVVAPPPSAKKKIVRYVRLLAGQVVFIIFSLVLFQVYERYPSRENFLIYTFSFALVGLVATWLMYSMIRNFSTDKRLIRFVFATFFISFCTGIFATNPLDPLPFDSSLYLILVLINQVGSFFSFLFILVLMIRDIFARSHATRYRLVGAACIYFNIGIVFTFVYATINVLVPNAMGLGLPADFISYMHCVNYSFTTLAGIDPPYQVDGVIQSVAVIESLVANLYIVLLIGRLLSR